MKTWVSFGSRLISSLSLLGDVGNKSAQDSGTGAGDQGRRTVLT